MNIIVIGGGAAGLMAAGTAAEQGAQVTLLETNEKVGRKLFITGKGRCNVCNNCDVSNVLHFYFYLKYLNLGAKLQKNPEMFA